MSGTTGFVRYSGTGNHYMNGIRTLIKQAVKDAGKQGLTMKQFKRWLIAGGYTYKDSTVQIEWSNAKVNGVITDHGRPFFLP